MDREHFTLSKCSNPSFSDKTKRHTLMKDVETKGCLCTAGSHLHSHSQSLFCLTLTKQTLLCTAAALMSMAVRYELKSEV